MIIIINVPTMNRKQVHDMSIYIYVSVLLTIKKIFNDPKIEWIL